jgi:SAM-dependent methyltransferase
MAAQDPGEIRAGIARFPYWHYEFDLHGERTPAPPGLANRHRERRRYFFDPLVRACGGTLAGKRVLDLGCNAGWWSLAAIESGCDYVVGVDTKDTNVAQARFVFETLGVEPGRYEFMVGSTLDLDSCVTGSFDVVLFLGLLYHLSSPVSALRDIAARNDDLLVIDTALSRLPGASFVLKRGEVEHTISRRVDSLVMHPTRGAVEMLAAECGYRSVTLKPQFASYESCGDYRLGRRRAFICSKKTDLDRLGLPSESTSIAGTLSGIASMGRAAAERVLGRTTRTGVG